MSQHKMIKKNKTLIEICDATWEIRETTPKKLEQMSSKEPEKRETLDGLTDFDKQTIYLSRYLHPHRKGVVLAHELLHVIYDHSGYKGDNEEESIRAIEHGVYSLLTSFPTKYVYADIERSRNVPETMEKVKRILGFKPKTRRKKWGSAY